MVEKVLERLKSDVEEAEKALKDASILLKTAVEAGIDVSAEESEHYELQERVKKLKESIDKSLKEIKGKE